MVKLESSIIIYTANPCMCAGFYAVCEVYYHLKGAETSKDRQGLPY